VAVLGSRGRASVSDMTRIRRASSSQPGRSAWRAASRASRDERSRAAAAGRHASLRLQDRLRRRPSMSEAANVLAWPRDVVNSCIHNVADAVFGPHKTRVRRDDPSRLDLYLLPKHPPGASHFDLASTGIAAAMNGHHRSLMARMSDKIFCRLSSGISLFGFAKSSRLFSTFDQNCAPPILVLS
jgi:hypothetical protein